MSLIINNDIKAMKQELDNLILNICNNKEVQKRNEKMEWEDIDISTLYYFIMSNIRVKPESQVFRVGDKFRNERTREEFVIVEIAINLYKLINAKTFKSFGYSFRTENSYITEEEFEKEMLGFQCILTKID